MFKETMKLKDIKGVGDSLSAKLINYYGSERIALNQISQANILSLKESGISESKAINIIKTYKSKISGETIDSPLMTADIKNIYHRIIRLLTNFAQTEYTKTKIHLNLLPYSSNNMELISKNREDFKLGESIFSRNKQNLQEISSFYKNFTYLNSDYSKFEIQSRKIFTTIPESIKIFQKLKILDYCSIEIIKFVEEISNERVTDELNLLFTEHEILESELPNLVILPENVISDPWKYIIPEKIIHFFSENLEIINNALKLSNLIIIPEDVIASFPIICDNSLIDQLDQIKINLNKIQKNGDIDDPLDDELLRLKFIRDNYERIVDHFHNDLNKLLEKKIENINIQLEGKILLDFLKNHGTELNSPLNQILEENVHEVVYKEISNITLKVVKKLKLNSDESDLINDLFYSEQVFFPVEPNEDVLEILKRNILFKIQFREFTKKQELAEELEGTKKFLSDLVKELLEIEYYLTIGVFGEKFKLKLPNIQNKSSGMAFKQGKNILLAKNNELINVEPIDYKIGLIDPQNESKVVLLSGANSGGKTSILQLIAQNSLLTQMGLGVPSKTCKINIFDQIYYFQKPTGNNDAGAFENALHNFSKIVSDNKTSKLIIADEMESISEPEASSKVISALFDILAEQNNVCGIFVSHLADQISKNCKYQIRIDGVEASGLDKDLNLIVNRNPKINYHARSTPQLIVEKLIKKSSGFENSFYKLILSKFK